MKYISALTFFIISICCLSAKEAIQGVVTKVDAENQRFTVQPSTPNARPIAGQVSSGDASIHYTGKQIRAIYDDSRASPALEFIWPIDSKIEEEAKSLNLSVESTTINPHGIKPLKIGDMIPPFALYDQNANPRTHQNFLGNTLVVNFIFTRCNKPDMCPQATKHMAELQKLCRESLIDNVHFITFTFDPMYDTPGTLNLYGRSYNIDFSNYSFLTGNPELIKRLTRLFGIYATNKGGDTSHTVTTTIIDPKGSIIYGSNKNNWDPQKFLSIIRKVQNKEKILR